MTAAELAAWLRDHGHIDVEVRNDGEVRSVNRARKLRRYVLDNCTTGQLVGGDYWRIVR